MVLLSSEIFVINPGSTSTKVAWFDGDRERWSETVRHNPSRIASFPSTVAQYRFRMDTIEDAVQTKGYSLDGLDIVVGRGGIVDPIPGGTYSVDQALLQRLRSGKPWDHASNLGGIIAEAIASPRGIPAVIVDPVSVDELDDVVRLSGLPELPRISLNHALNVKATVRKAARDLEKDWRKTRFVVAHIGGGLSVCALRNGRLAEFYSGNDGGPFSPERAGGLPAESNPGETFQLESDPPRPGFLPGVLLAACWTTSFGPFRQEFRVPLVSDGPAVAEGSYLRRGLWLGQGFLEARDPFGLFSWRIYRPEVQRTIVPPEQRELAGDGQAGLRACDSASASRPKEDAEELLERREYRSGDDIRKLDWKQMARTGDMLVRIGDDTVPLRGRVWVDVLHEPVFRRRRRRKRRSGHSSRAWDSGGFFSRPAARRSVDELDELLIAVDALVRRLMEHGQDVNVRLPGEKDFSPAREDSWSGRLAESLPAPAAAGFPPKGERLWLCSRPGRRPADALPASWGSLGGFLPDLTVTRTLKTAEKAKSAGVAVTLGFPAAADLPVRSKWAFLLQRRPAGEKVSRRAAGHRRAAGYRRALSLATERVSRAGLELHHV